MSKIFKLKYYSDASHGWVAVKRKILEELNIADKITLYSYMKGDTAYLEEDSDLGTLVRALNVNNIPHAIVMKPQSRGQHPIRFYQRYMH